VSRESGAGRHQSRHRDLHHRGAERKQPPDLTDDATDHGSTDADVFTVIKRGVPSTMMPGFTGQLSDDDVWNVVNYVRSLQPRK
jgi:mono/diheme cytochrome c family protein